ncbi:MAG: TIGR00374 family protein [Polaribacter sp.]|nr:MAG: TIGR00374 family protein [Polaribacter sp.]
MASIKKISKNILPLILGGFFVWYSLKNISIETIFEHFKNADYFWVCLGLFFGVLSHLSRAYRWKYLLDPLGYKPRFTNSTMAVLVAYLVNLALPRAGEISRATVMDNYEDIPFEKGFGTIVAERIADVIMLLIIIGITLLIQFEFIYNLLIQKEISFVKIGFVLLILIVGFYIFTYYIKKSKSGFLFKIKNFVNGLIEGLLSIFKMKHKWKFIFHTVFIWTMYVVMFWITTFSIDGLDVPLKAVFVGFIAGALSIAVTNGGIGTYPVAVATAFSLFGINSELANAFGWIMWSAQTFMIVAFGGLAFLFLPIYNKIKQK